LKNPNLYLLLTIDAEDSSSEEELPSQPQQDKGKAAPTTQTTGSTAPQVKKPQVGGKKWEGEDEDGDVPVVCPQPLPNLS
jgi:hypothetical protein